MLFMLNHVQEKQFLKWNVQLSLSGLLQTEQHTYHILRIKIRLRKD